MLVKVVCERYPRQSCFEISNFIFHSFQKDGRHSTVLPIAPAVVYPLLHDVLVRSAARLPSLSRCPLLDCTISIRCDGVRVAVIQWTQQFAQSVVAHASADSSWC